MTMVGPTLSFLKKYKLDEKSHPADWLNALRLLTLKEKLELVDDVNVKGDWKTKFAISNWTAYTNMKTKITNAESGVTNS